MPGQAAQLPASGIAPRPAQQTSDEVTDEHVVADALRSQVLGMHQHTDALVAGPCLGDQDTADLGPELGLGGHFLATAPSAPSWWLRGPGRARRPRRPTRCARYQHWLAQTTGAPRCRPRCPSGLSRPTLPLSESPRCRDRLGLRRPGRRTGAASRRPAPHHCYPASWSGSRLRLPIAGTARSGPGLPGPRMRGTA